MHTPFFIDRYIRPIRYTLLMEEVLSSLVDRELTRQHVTDMLVAFGINDPQFIKRDYISSRIQQQMEQAELKERTENKGAQRLPGFGRAYYMLFSQLSSDIWRLMVAAWGLTEARRMYCEEDMDDVRESLDIWMDMKRTEQDVLWEAVAYGTHSTKYKDEGKLIFSTSSVEGQQSLKDFMLKAQEMLKKVH